jgi:replicative DNA helicase
LKILAKNNGDALLGAASLLTQLDQQLSGFEAGKIYLVAARPAMGKTTLGLNLVEGIAQTTGGVVGVFSIEMPTEQMVSKMIAS